MKHVYSYNYFPSPRCNDLQIVADAIIFSGIRLSHVGKDDPPKKWNGNNKEFIKILEDSTDSTNYTFIRDIKAKIETTITIHNNPVWESSSISISGTDREYIEKICVKLAEYLNSYICISTEKDEYDFSKNHDWKILYKNEKCPASLLKKIENAYKANQHGPL